VSSDSLTKSEPSGLHSYGETLKSRRTVHFFQPGDVPVALIYDAIEIARWAPNHRLTEPWHFYLLGKDTIGKVIELITDIKSSGKSDPNRDAVLKRLRAVPGWLVVTCKVSEDPLLQQEDYAACACAIQNMMLYLWQAGIGVKWTTGNVVRDERFFELLGLDMNEEMVVGLFWYGFPKTITPQKRREPDDIISMLD
jgi:nitroreductase